MMVQGSSVSIYPLCSNPAGCAVILARVCPFEFSLVNRKCSSVAHELAQFSNRGVEATVLSLESPPSIDELLANDCNANLFYQ